MLQKNHDKNGKKVKNEYLPVGGDINFFKLGDYFFNHLTVSKISLLITLLSASFVPNLSINRFHNSFLPLSNPKAHIPTPANFLSLAKSYLNPKDLTSSIKTIRQVPFCSS